MRNPRPWLVAEPGMGDTGRTANARADDTKES